MIEVWFTYNGSRVWRECRDTQERDSVVEALTANMFVSDIQVIERSE